MPGDQGAFREGRRLADLLAASGVPASTYHYNKAKGPKAPTRPELWEGVAEVFSRTANGCGHRQIAMCLRAEKEASVANKTVLKIMHEMGISCGIRRETDYHKVQLLRASSARPSRTCSAATSRPTGRGRSWARTSPSSSRGGARPTWPRPTTSAARRSLPGRYRSIRSLMQQEEIFAMLLPKVPEGAPPHHAVGHGLAVPA